jgi:hypothetical protein
VGITLIVVGLLVTDAQPGLREFETRIETYVELHRALEVHTPPRTLTPDPRRIVAAADALAAAVVAARPQARQGDIFTPAAEVEFRRRIRTVLASVDVDRYLRDLYEGDDFKNLRAEIHGRDLQSRVPSGLPVLLLWVLPELPPELDYRIVGRDLALWDEHAAMVIDFIPNAFPQQSFT